MEYLLQDGLIIIPVLYIIGEMIKGIERIKDKYIPLILMVFGIGFSVAIMGANVDSVIQGILLTGTTVYGNQVYKQMKK
ncbi:MAG: phage holin family protein [Acutalibacteraceae bacterium]